MVFRINIYNVTCKWSKRKKKSVKKDHLTSSLSLTMGGSRQRYQTSLKIVFSFLLLTSQFWIGVLTGLPQVSVISGNLWIKPFIPLVVRACVWVRGEKERDVIFNRPLFGHIHLFLPKYWTPNSSIVWHSFLQYLMRIKIIVMNTCLRDFQTERGSAHRVVANVLD